MNYFKNTNNEIFAYDTEQVAAGYGADLTPLESGEYTDGTEIKPFKLDATFEQVVRDVNGAITAPLTLVDSQFAEAIQAKIATIKSAYKAYSAEPVTVDLITYNGGDSSASAINGAIQLAQANTEPDMSLWDVDNVLYAGVSFTDAMLIAQTIATQYRDRMFERSAKIAEANAAVDQSGLDAIILPVV